MGLLMGIGACVPQAAQKINWIQTWAADPSGVVGPHDLPRDNNDPSAEKKRPILLTGAINETVAFQFVLRSTHNTRHGLSIGVEDLISPAGTLSRETVRIYRHWPMTIDRYPNWYLRSVALRKPRDIPDVLVPIDALNHGQPFTVLAGENLVLWIEIKIPFLTHIGTYKGAVTVQDEQGLRDNTPIELDVRDVVLNPDDALPILARVQLKPIIAEHTNLDADNPRLILSDPAARRVLQDTFALLHEHGLCPMTDEIHPRLKQNLDGSIELDWKEYDAFCGPWIDGSAYHDKRSVSAWPLPVDLSQPDPAQYGGIESASFADILTKSLSAAAAHFQKKDWLDQAYVYFNMPDRINPNAADLDHLRRLANLTHQANQRLPFVTRLIPQSMTPFGWYDYYYEDLTSLIDIWSTPARYQHQQTLTHLQHLGKRTWLFSDRPPFSGSLAVEASPIDARSLPWQAFLQGHQAIYLDQVSQWPPHVLDTPIRSRRVRSDTWLIYPGKLFGMNKPVGSVRLKQLQLGIQDYQRLRLLEKNGHGETARLIAGSLIKAAGINACGDNFQDGLYARRVNDPALWALGRRLLDDELQMALHPEAMTPQKKAAMQANWFQFLRATRHIEARSESARLHVDDRPNHSGFLMSYEVAIRSELRTPLTGRLQFGPLPAGVKRLSDRVPVGPLPEMGMARKQVVASMPDVPSTDLDGHYNQMIVFDAETSGKVDITATASIVQASPAPRPIVVDGRLDDWPPSELNAVGDFRLITNRVEGRRPKANSQTVAYFSYDDEMLYIGIHAATQEPRASARAAVGVSFPHAAERHDSGTPPPMRNYVEYEDLMPSGEDLVEILIDPTNAATQCDDLFHIVIKSNGATVFERGVSVIPPIGQVRPWPSIPPRCAVVRTNYGWSAELAIPLSTFGPSARAHRVWGINLARLEPVRGEYSDWARAPRYCYDPRSLGNLLWPK